MGPRSGVQWRLVSGASVVVVGRWSKEFSDRLVLIGSIGQSVWIGPTGAGLSDSHCDMCHNIYDLVLPSVKVEVR